MSLLVSPSTLKDLAVSIIVPTYNEQKCVLDTLQKIALFGQKNLKRFEIIVADDGSQDQTVNLARRATQKYPQIKLLINKKNQGKGAVVRQGLAEASLAYSLFLDADLATGINELGQLPALITKSLGKPTVWIGSRYLKKSRLIKKQPLARRFVSRVANKIIRLFFLPHIHDTQNGFKVFRTKEIQPLLTKLALSGWFFDVELLYAAKKAGLNIIEFPISWRDREDSRLNVFSDAKKTWPEIVRFIKNIKQKKY